ncbi:MAG TPA: glycosyltransferase family 2 protein [Balneolales bacterium]|nr:glycosyltransferase family 2 protein [Balneolales bacterium]
MDLSVCIVNWNTKSLLKQCLKSIYSRTQGIKFEIIIVDNASWDGSVEMLKKEFPHCKVIESNINMGFSKGNNLAIKHARGRYVLFLNPDTELRTNALSGMVKFLENNQPYGAVGCKLLNKDLSIQLTCARSFPTPFREFCFLSFLDRIFLRSKIFESTEMRYWDHQKSKEVDCLSGACVMTRRKVLEQIGGFDESFFMYGEDIEFCYRIRNNGMNIFYLAEEEIIHYSGASSSQIKDSSFSAVMQRESNYKFIKNNYGTDRAVEFRILVLIGSVIRIYGILGILPLLMICSHYKKKLSVFSFKKYFKLILWALNLNHASFVNSQTTRRL